MVLKNVVYKMKLLNISYNGPNHRLRFIRHTTTVGNTGSLLVIDLAPRIPKYNFKTLAIATNCSSVWHACLNPYGKI